MTFKGFEKNKTGDFNYSVIRIWRWDRKGKRLFPFQPAFAYNIHFGCSKDLGKGIIWRETTKKSKRN